MVADFCAQRGKEKDKGRGVIAKTSSGERKLKIQGAIPAGDENESRAAFNSPNMSNGAAKGVR